MNPPMPQKQNMFQTTHCYGQLVCIPKLEYTSIPSVMWQSLWNSEEIPPLNFPCTLSFDRQFLFVQFIRLRVVSRHVVGYVSVVAHIQGCSQDPRYNGEHLLERQFLFVPSLLL